MTQIPEGGHQLTPPAYVPPPATSETPLQAPNVQLQNPTGTSGGYTGYNPLSGALGPSFQLNLDIQTDGVPESEEEIENEDIADEQPETAEEAADEEAAAAAEEPAIDPAALAATQEDANGGGPEGSATAEPEGTGPSPSLSNLPASITNWKEAMVLLGIEWSAVDTEEEFLALLASKGLELSNIEDGISWEEAHALNENVTRNFYNTLSVGGKGVDGDGKVTVEDAQRFYEKVILRLSDGLDTPQEVINKYISIVKFKMVNAKEAVRLSHERWHNDDSLYRAEDRLSVKALVNTYVSEGLRDLACVILGNILNVTIADPESIGDELELTEEQLETFYYSMFFLGKLEEPKSICSHADGIPKIDGDTPEHFLSWLTKGTTNEVPPPTETASTSSTQDSQQAQDDGLPTELREGMKQLFVYENGKFATGGANNDQYVPRAEVSDAEYLDAIGHFKAVINGSSVSVEFKRRAYAYIMQCYASLIERAPSYARAQELITEVTSIINTDGARTVLGTSAVIGQLIGFAQLAMDPNLMYKGVSLDEKLGRRLEAEEFAYTIYSMAEQNIDSATTLGASEKNQLKAQLAQILARMYHLSYREHALEIAQSIQGEIQVPSIGSDGQVQRGADGQMLTNPMAAEEFVSNIKAIIETHPAIAEGMSMIFVASADGQGSTLTNDAEKLMLAMNIFKAVMEDDENSTAVDRAKSKYWQAICEMTLASIAWENGVKSAATIAQFQGAAVLFNEASDEFKALIADLVTENPYDTRVAELTQLREGALAQIVRIAYTLITANTNGSKAIGREIAKLLDASDNTTQIRLGGNTVLTPKKARQMLLGSNHPNMNIQMAVTQQGVGILSSGQPQQNNDHTTTGHPPPPPPPPSEEGTPPAEDPWG